MIGGLLTQPQFMPWDAKSFVTCYVGLPVFATLYFTWKFLKKTKIPAPEDVDLFSGKAEIDEAERLCKPRIPRNFAEKIWFWIV